MNNLIYAIGYIEELLDMFKSIKAFGLNNEFYEIFVNFMEILNSEALKKKENQNQNYSRYYCKLYFERVFHDMRKYIEDSDIDLMNPEINIMGIGQNEKFKEIYKVQI